MNFVLVDREDNHLKEIMKSVASGFFESSEYLDNKEDLVNNGLLVACFGRYLARILVNGSDQQIADAVALVNRMAESSDPAVANYVETDVFGYLSLNEMSKDRLRTALRSSARSAYDRWMD